MIRTVILGAGGAAKVYLDNLRECPSAKVEIVGFVDDDPKLQGGNVLGVPVIGTYPQLPELIKKDNLEGFLVAYSDRLMKLRQDRFQECRQMGLRPVNIIHPNSLVSSTVKTGAGTFIGRGAIIDPDVRIGDNCAIHRGSTIGENSVLGDNVFLTGGVNLAAFVTVDKNTMFGTGSIVIPKCHIGEGVIVGAGAVVIDDVPPNVTVVGVPARIIKRRESL